MRSLFFYNIVCVRKLATRELFLAFRRVGEARGWADVEHEAVQCVKKATNAPTFCVAVRC